MKDRILNELFCQLSSLADLFDSTSNNSMSNELTAAKRRVLALPSNPGPEDARTLRQVADLLRSTAEVLEELGWTFQPDDAVAAAEKAEHLADLAEEEATDALQ